MKLSLELAGESPHAWVNAVMEDFPSFLQDHADCERKALAMAMSFVAKYPDRIAILPELIETGIEELEHFQQVFQLMQRFGIALKKEIPKDHYVLDLLKHCKSDVEGRFFDRLLLSSIIECRGAERFRLVYENHDDPEIKKFYHELWASEAKHGHIFVKFALEYFDEKKVYKRLQELNEIEYTVLKELPIRAALH